MKLKEITIEITQQCPNYCIHCSSMSSLSKNHMMPLEKVKELIDDVDILGCEQISFSGGEPFLHKDLVKMVAYAYRKGMRVAVYTSGIYNDSKGYSAIPIKHLMELLPYSPNETTLYGSSKYYRDHVMHVFRVWLIGVNLLLKDGCKYLKKIAVESGYDVNAYEKLSIWTLISLTHDLGYPLQKAMEVIERTKSMMYSFVSNPMVTMDLSFSGVQSSMNDFVLRFIGSRMWEIDPESRKTIEYTKDLFREEQERLSGLVGEDRDNYLKRKRYVARLQPKYYFKLQKSLEHSQHGILSSLIIYKHLLYFLESDYSLNEDYMFDHEDSRQYYIRREILRAIASHTCHDIYQNDMLRFSFLLILCDDAQEWGRKSITELYTKPSNTYTFESIECALDGKSFECKFKDKYQVNSESVKQVLDRFKRQSKTYINIFRDGQDTVSRNFNFTRQVEIDVIGGNNVNYLLKLMVTTEEQTKIVITKTDGEPLEKKEERYYATTYFGYLR